MRIAATEDVVQKGDATDVHLPSPSYWPIVLAFGLPFIGYGLIFNLWLCRPRRASCVVAGIYGWVLEPSDDPDAGHGTTTTTTTTATTTTAAEAAAEADAGRRAELEEAPRLTDIAEADDTSTAARRDRAPTPRTRRPSTHGHDTNTGISNKKLGMWVFLGSECLLFGGLISTYLLYKHNRTGTAARRPHELFDIPFTSVSSFVLLMSSLTMVLARRRHPARRPRSACASGCVATALLGAHLHRRPGLRVHVFVQEGLGFTTNVVGVGLLHAHRLPRRPRHLGIIMLLSLLVLSLRGNLARATAEAVEIVGLYWHFVDVVWILIFTVVYLIP